LKHLILSTTTIVTLATGLLSCAPNAKQLKEAIEKDPTIVFVAIEKAPEQFIEVVNKAAREAQQKGSENAQKEEQKARDEEFKNPLKPQIQEGRAIKGPKNAPITVIEYSSFECPYCARGNLTINEVLNSYPTQVRLIYKHLPLEFQPKSLPAAKYFEAIALQNEEAAYKFKNLVFENQAELRSRGETFLNEVAKKVGANLGKLKKDLENPKVMERINADIAEAHSFGITGTPGFIINGVSLKGAYPFSEFKAVIDRHLESTKGQ
jgi:protein-disulfide isomerase